MGYYRGDYYTGYRSGGVARGDYYRAMRGDPGFLGFLGAIGRGIVGFGKAALGIPTAAKTAAATAAVEALPATVPETGMIPAAAKIAKAVPGAVARVIKSPAGGTIAGTIVGGMIVDAAGNVIGRAKKRRHMNVCNQRALRRSMRRVHGFAKVARRTISFTSRVRMKKRGRRRAA